MMTLEENIKMYKEKKAFIDAVNKAFQVRPKKHSVESIRYELYKTELKEDGSGTYFKEYIVVTFNGGAISVRTVSGNSDTANFREIGKLIDGGYYQEVEYYEALESVYGFEKVEL